MGVFVPKTYYFCVCDLYAAVDWLKLIGQSGGPGVEGGSGGEVSWISIREMCSPPYVRASERQTDRQRRRQTDTETDREKMQQF